MTINFSFRDPADSNSQPRFEALLRWKFGTPGFIFVSARNRVALSDEDTGDSGVQIATDLTMEELVCQVLLMRYHFVDSILRVAHKHNIVAVLPNIKYVSTVDDMEQRIVVLDQEDIAILKQENTLKVDDKVFLKLWKAPSVVKLPLSRCIMKEVSLIYVGEVEGCHAVASEKSFEEEEYSELAAILVKEEASVDCIVSMSALLGY